MELDKWLSQLDVKAERVLDIGGAQEQMPHRVKSWDVKEYLIADLPEPHKDSPKADLELDINIDHHDDVTTFDMVFCLEVFDYVWNPVNAIKLISNCLEDDGIAWVSFPSIYPLHQPVEDDALRFMPGAIKKLADYADLTITEMIPRHFETNMWEQTYRTERMRAAKHEDHNFSGWIVGFTK